MRQAAAATEYVEIPITVDEDPTADQVFIAIADPWLATPDLEFHPADWKAGAANPYIARLLVGPDGALELTAGTWYAVSWKATDSPEEPHRSAGVLYAF